MAYFDSVPPAIGRNQAGQPFDMPHYRVAFEGTLLVEAPSVVAAEVTASGWRVAMTQATLGAEPQPITTGRICAVDSHLKKRDPVDVSAEFAAHMQTLKARQDPVFRKIGETAARTHYGTDTQPDWEDFESDALRSEESGEPLEAFRQLLVKAVIDGAFLYQNEAMIEGGGADVDVVRKDRWSEKSKLKKQAMLVADIIAARYLKEFVELSQKSVAEGDSI